MELESQPESKKNVENIADNAHVDDNNTKCYRCSQVFESRAKLFQHLRTAHLDINTTRKVESPNSHSTVKSSSVATFCSSNKINEISPRVDDRKQTDESREKNLEKKTCSKNMANLYYISI
jgi:hypothetical protein